jgi:hypothetical protein
LKPVSQPRFGHLANAQGKRARKKAAVASGPKFREETPKKGSSTATPIAVLHCKK